MADGQEPMRKYPREEESTEGQSERTDLEECSAAAGGEVAVAACTSGFQRHLKTPMIRKGRE